jgi:NADPH:quinone reductase-like Zn-dependent oxidoreductase
MPGVMFWKTRRVYARSNQNNLLDILMKAIVCTGYGPPEVLQLREVEKPTPKNNEVLIKIYAAAVTASDSLMRRSDLPVMFSLMRRLAVGFTKPRKSVTGFVLAGDVEAVGKDVKLFREGDQVYGSTGMRQGAYAEYACMPEEGALTGCLAIKPATMSYEEAAAVPYGALLASHFMNKGKYPERTESSCLWSFRGYRHDRCAARQVPGRRGHSRLQHDESGVSEISRRRQSD